MDNSFEHNDACPKCAADVTGFKGTFGLTPGIPARGQIMAESLMSSLNQPTMG
jgi:hypothetical protein